MDTEDMNNIINHHLTDIYETQHQPTADYVFSSSVQSTFTNIGHMLDNKTG